MFTEPIPHDEAVAFIADKPAVTADVFYRLLPELRMRAFAIARLESLDDIIAVQKELAKLPAGGDWDEVQAALIEKLTPAWGNGAPRQAELLMRMHGKTAYAAANFRRLQANADIFTHWKYVTLRDDRVRDSHAALDGLILPADSEFWRWHFPPWEWMCRCDVIGLMAHEVEYQRELDLDRPIGQRLVFEPGMPEYDRLIQSGELYRSLPGEDGNIPEVPTLYNVKSRSQKGDETGFEWEPGSLRLPLQKLRAKYQDAGAEEAFVEFESWARETIPEGMTTTVWDWLDGQPAEYDVALNARRSWSVSSAFSEAPAQARQALRLIDSVHDAIPLNPATIELQEGKSGHYTPSVITIGKHGDGPMLQTLHEVGHKLWHEAIRDQLAVIADDNTTKIQSAWEGVFSSIRETKSWSDLALSPTSLRKAYLMQSDELWARAYAQFITEEAQTRLDVTPGLKQKALDQLKTRQQHDPLSVWQAEDFRGIATAIRLLLKALEWD